MKKKKKRIKKPISLEVGLQHPALELDHHNVGTHTGDVAQARPNSGNIKLPHEKEIRGMAAFEVMHSRPKDDGQLMLIHAMQRQQEGVPPPSDLVRVF